MEYHLGDVKILVGHIFQREIQGQPCCAREVVEGLLQLLAKDLSELQLSEAELENC